MHSPDTSTPLFAEKYYPETLPAEELDRYLRMGWYRMGQSIFTTHFLCFSEKFYSALWIRLDLSDHLFRKSQRKLMRKNNDRFQVKFAPFQLTREKEELFWRYKKEFKGFLAGSLEESLLDGEEFNVFNTHEIQIFDDEQLIGLSFFDLGEKSASSIMGIYDPTYNSHSLGYYTMLLEIEFCQKNGFKYYYPGYIVPGYNRFDYKVRIGEIEVYQMSNREWAALDFSGKYSIPVQEMETKLQEISQLFDQAEINNHFYYYPLFEANLFGFWSTQYLDFPLFLQLHDERKDLTFFYFIVYDPREISFKLIRCSNIENHSFFFNKSYINIFVPEQYFMTLSSVEAILFNTKSIEDMRRFIQDKTYVFI